MEWDVSPVGLANPVLGLRAEDTQSAGLPRQTVKPEVREAVKPVHVWNASPVGFLLATGESHWPRVEEPRRLSP
jgi:hypothetical protein